MIAAKSFNRAAAPWCASHPHGVIRRHVAGRRSRGRWSHTQSVVGAWRCSWRRPLGAPAPVVLAAIGAVGESSAAEVPTTAPRTNGGRSRTSTREWQPEPAGRTRRAEVGDTHNGSVTRSARRTAIACPHLDVLGQHALSAATESADRRLRAVPPTDGQVIARRSLAAMGASLTCPPLTALRPRARRAEPRLLGRALADAHLSVLDGARRTSSGPEIGAFPDGAKRTSRRRHPCARNSAHAGDPPTGLTVRGVCPRAELGQGGSSWSGCRWFVELPGTVLSPRTNPPARAGSGGAEVVEAAHRLGGDVGGIER